MTPTPNDASSPIRSSRPRCRTALLPNFAIDRAGGSEEQPGRSPDPLLRNQQAVRSSLTVGSLDSKI
jgi:hypothetical protein